MNPSDKPEQKKIELEDLLQLPIEQQEAFLKRLYSSYPKWEEIVEENLKKMIGDSAGEMQSSAAVLDKSINFGEEAYTEAYFEYATSHSPGTIPRPGTITNFNTELRDDPDKNHPIASYKISVNINRDDGNYFEKVISIDWQGRQRPPQSIAAVLVASAIRYNIYVHKGK